MKDGLRRGSVLWLAVTGTLMAMTVILSLSVFSVPVPGGHLYFCDVIINIAALLLDPLAAFFVGGVGSFLGDLLFYPAPMFVSLVTHGLQAAAVSLIAHGILPRHKAVAAGIGVVIGSLIMVLGYTLGRAYVYSTPEYAVLKLPFEFLQAGFGAAAAMILCYPLRLIRIFHSMLHEAR